MISLFATRFRPLADHCSTCAIIAALSRDGVLSRDRRRQKGQPQSASRLYRRYTRAITRISDTHVHRAGGRGATESPVGKHDTRRTHRSPDACLSAVQHQHVDIKWKEAGLGVCARRAWFGRSRLAGLFENGARLLQAAAGGFHRMRRRSRACSTAFNARPITVMPKIPKYICGIRKLYWLLIMR